MFGYDYSNVQWLFFFYFYCFCGWCFESAYVSIKTKKLTNRGFMRGPFLPLYGSGGMMMLIVSSPFQDNILLTYLSGVVGATVLEYVTGVTMEHLFKVRYWDYSYRKIQFQGHICLVSSLAWGFLTIAMTKVVHKPVEAMVLAFPQRVLSIITILLTVYIAGDFTLAFKHALDMADLLVKMNKLKESATDAASSVKEKATDAAMSVKEKATDAASMVKEKATDAALSVKEKASDAALSVKEKASDAALSVKEKATGAASTAKDELAEWKNHVKETIATVIFTERSRAYHRSVFRGNPTMTSVKFKEAFEELRRNMSEYTSEGEKR